MSELEVLTCLALTQKKDSKLWETGMLEQICHLRPAHPPWEEPEDILVTTEERK